MNLTSPNIRVVSKSKDGRRAQVIETVLDANGVKRSYTSHVHLDPKTGEVLPRGPREVRS